MFNDSCPLSFTKLINAELRISAWLDDDEEPDDLDNPEDFDEEEESRMTVFH